MSRVFADSAVSALFLYCKGTITLGYSLKLISKSITLEFYFKKSYITY